MRDGVRNADGGWFVPINVDAVIERVYVSPFAADWFGDVVVA